MMTKSHLLKSAIFSAIALASVLSSAEVKLVEEEAINEEIDETTEIEAERHNMLVDETPQTSNLRCWQYGELLFEEINISQSQMAQQAMMLVFESDNDNTQQQLHVINMGDSTCLYKSIESKR